MVKSVCQEIFKCKATASKFPAETGHKGTLAAKPVIKKVTECHLLPCILYCSSISSTRKRQHNSRLPRWCSGKEPACQGRRCRRRWFDPRLGKIPWRRKWQPSPVFLPGASCGQRSLMGYSPWGDKRVGHDSALDTRALLWFQWASLNKPRSPP